jgi:hypothetical protein
MLISDPPAAEPIALIMKQKRENRRLRATVSMPEQRIFFAEISIYKTL